MEVSLGLGIPAKHFDDPRATSQHWSLEAPMTSQLTCRIVENSSVLMNGSGFGCSSEHVRACCSSVNDQVGFALFVHWVGSRVVSNHTVRVTDECYWYVCRVITSTAVLAVFLQVAEKFNCLLLSNILHLIFGIFLAISMKLTSSASNTWTSITKKYMPVYYSVVLLRLYRQTMVLAFMSCVSSRKLLYPMLIKIWWWITLEL